MTSSPIRAVAVLGLGTMGQGIAAAAAAGGHPVRVVDRPDSLDEHVAALRMRYGRLRAAAADGVLPPLDVHAATTVAEAVRGADLVVEAVPEDLAVKRSVLSELASVAPKGLVVATNTSSLPLDRFALPEAMRALVERGRVGVKAGAGFREYTPAQVDELIAGRDERYRRLLAAAQG